MKQLLILSGKGGTGKTTVATAFIKLLNAKAFADCDVDAPNLHLLINNDKPDEETDFYGLPKAIIDKDGCTGCGLCKIHCRFNAIEKVEDEYMVNDRYKVNPYACEGCGVCEIVCPLNAVTLMPDVAGDLMLYNQDALFSTAKLRMGSGTSGKLVSEVKKQLKQAKKDVEISIVDGSPGIGCPVIASISGADLVLIVAEPSISGMSDMTRIVDTARTFKMKVAICVNKSDTNLENTEKIKDYCDQQKLPFVGEIPFDKSVVMALNDGKSVLDTNGKAKKAIVGVYDKTIGLLMN